jgi:hypothetical protein
MGKMIDHQSLQSLQSRVSFANLANSLPYDKLVEQSARFGAASDE